MYEGRSVYERLRVCEWVCAGSCMSCMAVCASAYVCMGGGVRVCAGSCVSCMAVCACVCM